MNYYIKRTNSRCDEYEDYLHVHISNVSKAWLQFLKPVIIELYPELVTIIEENLKVHDKSKYTEEEYSAYCNYFYPTKACPANKDAFDLAWLHHQRENPHHWQYWVLIEDIGHITPLDMPVEYIVEMLCDWHSFSGTNPISTAYKWYTDNKHCMRLSSKTIKLVEELLEYLKEPLK